MRLNYTELRSFILFLLVICVATAFSFSGNTISVYSGELDGFYSQMLGVENSVENDIAIFHTLRYLAISPFIFIEKKMGDIYLTFFVVIIFYISIHIMWKRQLYISILFFPLLLLPYMFSLRSTLCMLSIIFCYYALREVGEIKLKVALITLAIFLGNLSSGVLINIAVMIAYRLYLRYKIFSFFFIAVFIITLLQMFINKFIFFSQHGNPLVVMFMRNNIFNSYEIDMYKFVFYVGIFLIYIFSVVWFRKAKNNEMYIYSLISLISLIMFEGLGALSMVPVIFFHFFNVFLIRKRV